ncbi:hypothetical protein [Ancylobacter pratisalsi]|uniref:Uncharacterized protein n=1 Tax=Ancylobacter pratisalsi TaxID=1745854 RepID=A0A6P1YI28_9HYPH|nr:hypothetical protein [Ancylobacter pratisalsi]QIB32620.1 hypothetical protein G3A50_02060 [Ancylobacter pratisalsi]
MTGPITWEVVIAMGTILGAIVGVWLRIEYRIKAEVAPKDMQLAALHAEVRLLDKQLGEHKLYAAEHYARNDSLAQMREEILTRLDNISGRIDKAFTPAARARGNG